jgi:drug/metabolite transporter (DMT)-like permease
MLRPGVRHILLATFFFALMQVGVKALPRLPFQEVVLFRAIISVTLAWIILKRQGLSALGRNKPVLLLRGFCGAFALILFFYTLQTIPLATAVTLQYLSPIFTILFAAAIMKENATWRQWVSFAVAMGGVVLVKGFDPRVALFDLFLGVLSALFSGLAYNFVRKLKDSDDPLVVVFYFPLVTIPVILPFSFGTWIWPTPLEWLIVLFVGVCAQIAQMFMTRAYQAERASDITIYNYLGIIYAIVFGLLLFNEAVEPLAYLGIGVVVVAVTLGSWKKNGRVLSAA